MPSIRQFLVASTFFSFIVFGFSQNQINPGNQIRWPLNCVAGLVYSPGLNTCVPQGGTANNPAGVPFDFQINGGSNFGVTSPNRTYTNPSGDFINQANVLSPLPRVNIQNPMFAGGADKTGVADSAPAINAAVAWSMAHPQGNSYPAVYLGSGSFLILSTIRIPCYIPVVGDGPSVSVILAGTSAGANWNALTIFGSGSPGYTPPVTPNPWSCPGSLQNFTVHAPGGHLYTGTLVEISQASNYFVMNLRLSNSGGRGIATLPNTERMMAINTEVDSSRLSVISNGNEMRWFNTNVNSPGADSSGYCFSPANCPGGVYPGNQWVIAQTVSSITANGTTLTLVINGGNNGSSNNGTSPLVVGHWFQLGGATNNPTLNGFYQITSVQNKTPTGTQYTVTAATTVNGTETPGSLTYKPSILPEVVGGAIVISGAEPEFYGGSLKALWYAPGITVQGHFGGKLEGFYLEGFPINGQPHENPAIQDLGIPPTTTITASLAANGTSAPVVNTDWAPCYVGDPADKNSAAVCNTYIFPADYAPGNSSPSSAVPGVNRNQYEKTQVEFSGLDKTGNFYNRWSSGSTAPNTTVWPSGSVVAVMAGTNYGPMQVSDNHLSSINDPSPTGPWSVYCVDGTNLTCSIATVGPVPNGFSTLSRAQMQSRDSVPGGSMMFLANEWWGTPTVKTFGSSTVTVMNTLQNRFAETSDALNGQLLKNNLPAVMATVSPADSSQSWLAFNSTGADAFSSNTAGLFWSLLSTTGNDTNIGTQVGAGSIVAGHQFGNSHCFYDMGTSAAAPHTLTRLCLKGGPNNTGANAGIEWDTWNGTAWVAAFTQSANTWSNFFTNTGAGTIAGVKNANFTPSTASGTFNGPSSWYDQFQWWNGTNDIRSGCGWMLSSNTAATVPPTGINYTYACNASTTLSIPLTWKFTLPSGSIFDMSAFTGGFKPPNQGRATLVAGTATVNTAAAASGSTPNYTLTNCVAGGTVGVLSVGTIVAGTSFVINSSNAADTSTVCWWIH